MRNRCCIIVGAPGLRVPSFPGLFACKKEKPPISRGYCDMYASLSAHRRVLDSNITYMVTSGQYSDMYADGIPLYWYGIVRVKKPRSRATDRPTDGVVKPLT